MADALKTPLYHTHLELGAKMVDFAGWMMPVQYNDGILAEHKHTREAVSIFDICHMGEFELKGQKVAEELDQILARPVLDQKVGSCRYNFLLTEQGTVIDDLIVYRMAEDDFFIVVNAGTKNNDAEHFKNRLSDNVIFEDKSDVIAKIDLQGPDSEKVLVALGVDKGILPGYYHWINTEIDGCYCLLSRTGYTGELGYELYIDVSEAEVMWKKLLQQQNVKPAGLGARDTLRLEMGYALYGHELDLDTTPVDAGYEKMLKLESVRSFYGDDALKTKKRKKRLVGIKLDGRRAAREHCEVLKGQQVIGHVTSGAFAPSLNCAVALAYIDAALCMDIGDEVDLLIGRKPFKGVIAELPFYKNGTARIKI